MIVKLVQSWKAVSAALVCGAGLSWAEHTPARSQSQIKGLLVFELNDGTLASEASQMNATLLKSSKEGAFELGFNQTVGEMMMGATEEVLKFIRVRHAHQIPLNYRIEFAFANKFSEKDGPSAAVVCALLADSIITGDEIAPEFAATGDMTATGEVRAVGGVADKLRGARKKGCEVIAIPSANESSIFDAYILMGLEPLYEIQIFTIESFNDARAIALSERDEEVQTALDEFAMVQDVLKKNEKLVFNGKVQEKLRKVYELMPNHLSAKLLILHANQKGPKKLSLLGSLSGIEQVSVKLDLMIQNDSYLTSGGNDDELAHLIYDLQRFRPQLDKRTVPYADAYLNLAQFIREVRGRKTWNEQLDREFKQMLAQLGIQRDKLLGNAKVQEELNES